MNNIQELIITMSDNLTKTTEMVTLLQQELIRQQNIIIQMSNDILKLQQDRNNVHNLSLELVNDEELKEFKNFDDDWDFAFIE